MKLAHVTITSDPSGAEVFDEQGHKLGVTPTEIGVPADGTERTLTLRHPHAKERTKTIAATGDMTVSVILERIHGATPKGSGSGKGSGKGKDKGSGDIMEPVFE